MKSVVMASFMVLRPVLNPEIPNNQEITGISRPVILVSVDYCMTPEIPLISCFLGFSGFRTGRDTRQDIRHYAVQGQGTGALLNTGWSAVALGKIS